MLNINFHPFPKLETERLELRQLKIEDVNDIFKIRSDEYMSEFLDRPICKSLDEAKKFIHMINEGVSNNKNIYWGIAKKGESKLIGTICLWQINDELEKAEIGFELLPEYQKNGFMLEAAEKTIEYGFSKMGLRIIEGEVDPNNTRSIGLMKKVGFELINEIREEDSDSLKEGKTVMYGLRKM